MAVGTEHGAGRNGLGVMDARLLLGRSGEESACEDPDLTHAESTGFGTACHSSFGAQLDPHVTVLRLVMSSDPGLWKITLHP